MKAIIKKATRVLGDYELKYPLDCDGEIMGKEFKIHLDNVVGKILFPKLSPDFVSAQTTGKLENTDHRIPGPVCPISASWGNEEDAFGCTEWGQTMAFPKGNSLVKRIILEFYLTENDIETDAQTIYTYVDSWFERFYDIYEIVSKVPIKKKEQEIPPLVQGYGFRSAGVILHTIDPNTKKLIPIHNKNDNGAHITVEVLNGHLKYEALVKIIDFTNEQKDLFFDYRYYLEGFRAFHEEDYKKTITVCAPALEASLLNGIRTFAKNKNIYFLDKLLKKYKMLGGYFALAKDIDMVLPTQDYQTALLNLRNDVVHNGYAPKKEETEKYLTDVRLYLDTFSTGILEK